MSYLYIIRIAIRNQSSYSIINMNLFANNQGQKLNTNLFASNNNFSSTNPNQQPSRDNQSAPSHTLPNQIQNNQNNPSTNNISSNPSNSNQQSNSKAENNGGSQLAGAKKREVIWIKQVEERLHQCKSLNQTKFNNIEFKTVFNLGISYFEPRQSQKSLYKAEHLNKQNFGWPKSVIGAIDPNVCSKERDNLNKMWNHIVLYISQLLHLNQMLVCQYLLPILQEESIYQNRLFMKYFNQGVHYWGINNMTIQQLFINETTINPSCELLSELLFGVLKCYGSEFMAMARIIQKLMNETEKTKRRYYREVIRKGQVDIVPVIWQKIIELCSLQLEKEDDSKFKARIAKKKELSHSLRNKDIMVVMNNFEAAALQFLIKLVTNILNKETFWLQEPKRVQLIHPIQAINFCLTQYSDYINNQSLIRMHDKTMKLGISFLLQMFPFPYFNSERADEKNIDKKLLNDITNLIEKSQAIILSPFKVLVLMNKKNEHKRNKEDQLESLWSSIPKQIEWMMRDEKGWQEWLAVFVHLVDIRSLSKNKDLAYHIMKMCKSTIGSLSSTKFWTENPRYQFKLIKNFLDNFKKQNGISQILPVFTKSTNSETKDLLTNFIGPQIIRKDVRDIIYERLNFSYKQQHSNAEVSPIYSKIMSLNDHYDLDQSFSRESIIIDKYPEQELKFFCKLVISSIDDLPSLEEQLFQCHLGTGIIICNLLFQWLYVIRGYNISGLKCIRYILQCIDILFNYDSTRSCLLIGLSLSAAHQQASNYIVDMISLACMKESFSEEYRQIKKLKVKLSDHLCNLVSNSMYMSQYFPMQCSHKVEPLYAQAYSYLINSNYEMLYQWFDNNKQISSYRSSFWFGTIILILHADRLEPRDFETIRLLMLKLKVNVQGWREEKECLLFVKKILDKSNIFKEITNSLQPILSHSQTRSPYKIQNLRFMTSIDSLSEVRLRAKIDESRYKLESKAKAGEHMMKMNVLGNISGSLQLLSCVIKLSFEENQYPLIKDLDLYRQIVKGLTDCENIFHYSLTINREETRAKQPQSSPYSISDFRFSHFSMPNQHLYEINILQVIANCINFQSNHQVSREKHTNKIMNYIPYLQIQEEILDEQNPSISPLLAKSDLLHNAMGLGYDELYSYDYDMSIGISGVLNLLGLLLLKGNGTVLYNCLINHDCKILNEIGEESLIGCKDQFQQLIRQIIQNNLNTLIINKKLPKIYQFLTIAINSSIFFAQQIICNFLKQLGSYTRKLVSVIHKPQHLYLLNKIGLFILSINYYANCYKEEVSTFMKYPENIVGEIIHVLSKMKNIDPIFQKQYDKKYLLLNIKLHHKLSLQILHKGTLSIFIELAKLQMLHQSPIIVEQIFTSLLTKFSYMLNQPPQISSQEVQKLQMTHKHYLGVQDHHQITMLTSKLTNNIHDFEGFTFIKPFLPFIGLSNCSYGRHFQYSPALYLSKVFHSSSRETRNHKQHHYECCLYRLYSINLLSSMEFCSQIAITTLFTFISNVLGIGDFGYVLQNCLQDYEISKMINKNNKIMMTKLTVEIFDKLKYRCSDDLPFQLIGSCCHKVTNLFDMSRAIIDFIQKNPEWQQNNDLTLLVQAQIIKSISSSFKKEESAFTKSQFSQFSKLITYLMNCTSSQFQSSAKVYLLFLHACVIGYHTNSITYNHRQILNVCLSIQKFIMPEMRGKSKIKANEETIMNNVFLISSILIEIISPSYTPNFIDCCHLDRKQTLEAISLICINLVTKRLKTIKILDLNFMGITTLVNSLLDHVKDLIDGDIYHKNERTILIELIREFYATYTKIIYELGRQNNEQVNEDLQLKINISETFKIIYETHDIFDLNSLELVFNYFGLLVKANAPHQLGDKFEKIQRTIKKNEPLERHTRYRLPQILNSESHNYQSQHSLGLVQLIEMKSHLNFVHALLTEKQYWGNLTTYSQYMEQTFLLLINQQSISKILSTGRSNKATQIYKVVPKTVGQILLNKIDSCNASRHILRHSRNRHNLNRSYNQKQQYGRNNQLQVEMENSENKSNLLDFTIKVQILGILHIYIESLNSGFLNSVALRDFCSKIMLNQSNSQINQTIWEKVSNILTLSMDFIAYNFIDPLRYTPEDIHSSVSLYKMTLISTDFAYETDFLSMHFQKLGINDEYSSQLEQSLAMLAISLLDTSRNMIQIWKSNDWKQSISWYQQRSKLLKQLLQWSKYLRKNLISTINQLDLNSEFEDTEQWLIHEYASIREALY